MNDKRFENHVATLKDLGEVKILIWEKPATRENGIRYLLYEGHLFVTGDFWNATYKWSSRTIDFEFLARLCIEYFHGNMSNLNVGVVWDWDSEKAMDWLKQNLARNSFIDGKLKEELLEEADEHSSSEDEWARFVNEHADEVQDDDHLIYGAGQCIPDLVRIHLQGIKMAMAQLRGSNKESEAK